MGIPGRPLVIRTTTVIVDDVVWCATGSSSLTPRGLSFDGTLDVVLADRQFDRGVGVAIRAHRKALMAMHLGVAPPASPQATPAADWVRLHQGGSAHAAFADLLAHGGNGKLTPIWAGPDRAAPGAVQQHPAELADPDGLGGASFIATVAAALTGNGAV